ncbi:hypothetical protein EDD17DRAFT_1604441 [Pisolithus thermaeus]|nr:hypothetical protein EDD17DRAFT_1604441 [Pisolithus thermaeus]
MRLQQQKLQSAQTPWLTNCSGMASFALPPTYTVPRGDDKPTFRLTEVLGSKSQFTFAIISSYSTSVWWIYESLELRAPVIMVAQPDLTGQAGIKNILPNWVMTVLFLRNGHGCQHMKVRFL